MFKISPFDAKAIGFGVVAVETKGGDWIFEFNDHSIRVWNFGYDLATLANQPPVVLTGVAILWWNRAAKKSLELHSGTNLGFVIHGDA